jgi:hypothetical protein
MLIIGSGRGLLALELSKHGFELSLLGSERSKPGSNMLNLLGCHAVAINVPDSSPLQALHRFVCEGDCDHGSRNRRVESYFTNWARNSIAGGRSSIGVVHDGGSAAEKRRMSMSSISR